MGVALDSFHWSPDTFWNASPHEFWSMIDARDRANKAANGR